MQDYMNPDELKEDLPHWKGILGESDWTELSRRIGWLTFEEIIAVVKKNHLLTGKKLTAYEEFMKH